MVSISIAPDVRGDITVDCLSAFAIGAVIVVEHEAGIGGAVKEQVSELTIALGPVFALSFCLIVARASCVSTGTSCILTDTSSII